MHKHIFLRKDVLECITTNQEIEETEGWLKQHNPIGKRALGFFDAGLKKLLL